MCLFGYNPNPTHWYAWDCPSLANHQTPNVPTTTFDLVRRACIPISESAECDSMFNREL